MLRFLFFLAILPALAPARTFISSDGKELDAQITSANDNSVTLRRNSDRREFRIPLARLSGHDREHVAAWRGHLEHPLGWQRLRIHGHGVTIAASCLPIYGPIERAAAHQSETNGTLELTLPLGAWVHLAVDDQEGRVEGLAKYDGATDWHLSARDDTLIVKSLPKGITIPGAVQKRSEDANRSFSAEQLKALRWGGSITTDGWEGSPLILPKTRFQAAKLKTSSLEWAMLPKSLRALQLRSSEPVDLAGIERLTDLEHLSIDAPAVTNVKGLTLLPQLGSLYLKAGEIKTDEYAVLGRLRSLRHLFLGVSENSSRDHSPHTFLSSHRLLESIAITYGSGYVGALDPGLIRSCKRLTRMEFNPVGSAKADYLETFPMLTDISFDRLDPAAALALMQSGHLKHLHTIRNAGFKHPLTNLPHLRNLEIGAASWPRKEPTWDQLPFLERLHLRSPTVEVLEKICAHPAFQAVEHLTLHSRSRFETAPLSRLPALRSLKLGSKSPNGPLDLNPFPYLETLELSRSRFSSIPTVRNLRALKIESSTFQQLGDGSPNKLTALHITGTDLENLDGVADSPDLDVLVLASCRDLASHSDLANSRRLGHLRISDCDKLPPALAK